MGFPEQLPIVVSDTQAYKQFGNAVVPVVAQAVGQQITKALDTLDYRSAECSLANTFGTALVEKAYAEL